MASEPRHTSDPSATAPPGLERFQVLALDGGGAKALFTAHVLARLEEDLGVRVVDQFDLIAGTSAGGVVALGLGAGFRPAEIVELYSALTARVFARSRWTAARRLTRPAYSGEVLREVLGEVFGDRLLGESTKRLIVPSWDVQRGEVHIFKTPHHERLRRDWRISMVDVAMATTAAPTYFPAAQVDGHRLIDGGVWANNPSVVAIGEAVSMLDVPLDAIRVLNVGTIDQKTIHSERLDTGGLAAWAKPAATLMITATSRGAQGTATHLIGNDKFARFDARVPGDIFALDRASPAALAGLAAGESRMLSPLYADLFADHAAAPYSPRNHPDAPSSSPSALGGAT